MLIITRKIGAAVAIGDNIVVHVLGVDPDYAHVKLGIEAPRNVAIERDDMRKPQPTVQA